MAEQKIPDKVEVATETMRSRIRHSFQACWDPYKKQFIYGKAAADFRGKMKRREERRQSEAHQDVT